MKNHKDEIWSCDFLVQHTALFSVVYIFIIMEISTRKIIGFNVTCNPTLAWVKQQIREATAFGVQPRILIHDNDGIYGQFGKDRRSHLGYGSHLDYWLKETNRHPWHSHHARMSAGDAAYRTLQPDSTRGSAQSFCLLR